MARLERLSPDHTVASFRSGNSDLDAWLHDAAATADRAGTARVYVWIDHAVIGYFAIVPHTVRRDDVPPAVGRGAPDVVPGILLARLAVAEHLHGLVVDIAAGFARLEMRSSGIDVTRPLARSRGSGQPFDRRRYELLCHLCAELVRHTVTTIGLLATSLTADAAFDSSRRAERAAFVDALRALLAWGAVDASAGDVDAYIESDDGNAILTADIARLHHLLAAATAPSTIDTDDPIAATDVLFAEPRYGSAADDDAAVPEEQRLRWLRHSLARRILDDPVVHFDELTASQRDYLGNPAGRRWLRDRVAQAGMTLEERADGLLAVDTDHLATDELFPAPNGIVHQAALLLIDVLAPSSSTAPAAWRR